MFAFGIEILVAPPGILGSAAATVRRVNELAGSADSRQGRDAAAVQVAGFDEIDAGRGQRIRQLLLLALASMTVLRTRIRTRGRKKMARVDPVGPVCRSPTRLHSVPRLRCPCPPGWRRLSIDF